VEWNLLVITKNKVIFKRKIGLNEFT